MYPLESGPSWARSSWAVRNRLRAEKRIAFFKEGLCKI
jgi:hypothetical protein